MAENTLADLCYPQKLWEFEPLLEEVKDLYRTCFYFWREHKLAFISYCITEDAKRGENGASICDRLVVGGATELCQGEGAEVLRQVTKGSGFDPETDGVVLLDQLAKSLAQHGIEHLFTLFDAFFIYWIGEGNMKPGFFQSPERRKLSSSALAGIETIMEILPKDTTSKRDSASYMLVLLFSGALRWYDDDTQTPDSYQTLVTSPMLFKSKNGEKVPQEKVKETMEKIRMCTRPYMRCDNCHAHDRDTGANSPPFLKSCGRCGHTKYCGGACQKEDWPFHKKVCKGVGAVEMQKRKTSKVDCDSDVDD